MTNQGPSLFETRHFDHVLGWYFVLKSLHPPIKRFLIKFKAKEVIKNDI
jgi:hypothetical protein